MDASLETVEDMETQDNGSESSPKMTTISKSEAAYHSDNVNMIMDLFEGKIIE